MTSDLQAHSHQQKGSLHLRSSTVAAHGHLDITKHQQATKNLDRTIFRAYTNNTNAMLVVTLVHLTLCCISQGSLCLAPHSLCLPPFG